MPGTCRTHRIIKYSHVVSVEEPEGKRSCRRRWEDNIKIGLTTTEFELLD